MISFAPRGAIESNSPETTERVTVKVLPPSAGDGRVFGSKSQVPSNQPPFQSGGTRSQKPSITETLAGHAEVTATGVLVARAVVGELGTGFEGEVVRCGGGFLALRDPTALGINTADAATRTSARTASSVTFMGERGRGSDVRRCGRSVIIGVLSSAAERLIEVTQRSRPIRPNGQTLGFSRALGRSGAPPSSRRSSTARRA